MDVYYKATKDNGVSSNTDLKTKQPLVYKLGTNIHPNPNRKSNDACGSGIHLSKTLTKCFSFVKDATEFYLAYSGVILGEDSEKVRCASCFIVKKLTPDEIKDIQTNELTEREREKRWVDIKTGLPPNRFVPDDWILKSALHFTQDDFNKQSIEIKTPNRTTRITNAVPSKDHKFVLSQIIR
jgi:hypothetical protein